MKYPQLQITARKIMQNNIDALGDDHGTSVSDVDHSVDGHGIATTIIHSSMAIVSMISSSIVVWLILHSRAKLTTIYHRILLGMSFGDFVLSLSFAHFNAMAPSDDDYFVWNARGNVATCSAQGFIATFGAGVTLLYSCSLNLYYLAVVKYQKSDEYIRRKIEPFLHGIPFVYALVGPTIALAKKNLNNRTSLPGGCYQPVYEPPHCAGYEDGQIPEGFEIPCGRGRDGAVGFSYAIMFFTTFIVPIVVGVSLYVIYRSISKQERNNARYGVNTLAISSQENKSNTTNEEGSKPGLVDTMRSLIYRIKKSACCGMALSENQQRSMSQVVLHRAVAYSTAYFLVVLPFIIRNIFVISDLEIPMVLVYLVCIFNPLQGFFNCCIFLYPKVTSAKSKGSDSMTWCQAIAKVFGSNRFNQNDDKCEEQPNVSGTQGTALSGRSSF